MKKRILSEGHVRRMMKLANIGTLSESFIDETEELEENGAGEYVDEGGDYGTDPIPTGDKKGHERLGGAGLDEADYDDTPLDEGHPGHEEMEESELYEQEEEEMDPEMGALADEEGDDPDADDLADFLEFINDKVEEYADMKGIDLEVEFEEEDEDDMMGDDLEDEEDLDMMGDEPEEDEEDLDMDMMGDEPEGPEEEEGPMMESLRREIEGSLDAAGFYMEEDIETDLINEVTRRVAHRLLMARANKG